MNRFGLLVSLLALLPLSGARADLPRQAAAKAAAQRVPLLDWSSVDIQTGERSDAKRSKYDGWVPKLSFSVFGNVRGGDMILAVLKSKKVIASAQCAFTDKWRSNVDEGGATNVSCEWDEEAHATTAGKHTIELTYKYTTETMEPRTSTLATLEFNVIKYSDRSDVGVKFVVDYDFRLGESYVYFSKPQESGQMRIFFWYKTQGNATVTNPDLPGAFLARCFVDGKPVGKESTTLRNRRDFEYTPFKGDKEQPTIAWRMGDVWMNALFAHQIPEKNFDEASYVSEMPGNWVCKMMFDGTVVRELKFTVNKPEGDDLDPIIVPHPTQAKVFTGFRSIVSTVPIGDWKFSGKYNEAALKTDVFLGAVRP